MSNLQSMPGAGKVVIVLILILFAAAVAMLFYICGRYRRLAVLTGKDARRSEFHRGLLENYAAAYKHFGQAVNTPAIIADSVSSNLGFPLFCERFLNNAVSLFVTLGLFGTFLGLSLSVASLTELIGYSNSTEWLSVLDSVGGGLLSALSGMGVAFYTSVVGVACSIILTILRAVFSPEGLRTDLETELELWLDHRMAPELSTERTKDDSELVNLMICGLNEVAGNMSNSLKETGDTLRKTMDDGCVQLAAFGSTVAAFNKGVRDFSEFDYNLRGTVERMDVATRDFVGALRRVSRDERSE